MPRAATRHLYENKNRGEIIKAPSRQAFSPAAYKPGGSAHVILKEASCQSRVEMYHGGARKLRRAVCGARANIGINACGLKSRIAAYWPSIISNEIARSLWRYQESQHFENAA